MLEGLRVGSVVHHDDAVRTFVRGRVRGGGRGWGRAGAARLGLGLRALVEAIGET